MGGTYEIDGVGAMELMGGRAMKWMGGGYEIDGGGYGIVKGAGGYEIDGGGAMKLMGGI